MITEISQSELNMFGRCGAQFEFRHIKGLKIPPSAAIHRGIAVHQSAQSRHKLLVECPEKAEEQTLEDMTDETGQAFEKSIEDSGIFFAEDEREDAKLIVGQAKDEAVKGAKLYWNHVREDVTDPVVIEKRFQIVLPEILERPFAGTIDLIHNASITARDGEVLGKRMEIVDLKTTRARWKPEDAFNNLQVLIYEWLAESHYGYKVPFIFRVLVVKKDPESQLVLGASSKQGRAALVERAKVFEKALKTGLFPPSTPGTWWCNSKWCGYWNDCPYVQKFSVAT